MLKNLLIILFKQTFCVILVFSSFGSSLIGQEPDAGKSKVYLQEAARLSNNAKELASESKLDEANEQLEKAKGILKRNSDSDKEADAELKQLIQYQIDTISNGYMQEAEKLASEAKTIEDYDSAIQKGLKAISVDNLPQERKKEIEAFVMSCEETRLRLIKAIKEDENIAGKYTNEKQVSFEETMELIASGKELASDEEYDGAEKIFNKSIDKLQKIGGEKSELQLKLLLKYLISFRIRWEQSLMDQAYSQFSKKDYKTAVARANEALKRFTVNDDDNFQKLCFKNSIKFPKNRHKEINDFIELCKERQKSKEYKEVTDLTYKDVDPGYKRRKYEIDVAMKNADLQIKNKQFTNARDSLEKVLVRDPYNVEAMDKLKKIYKILIKTGRERSKSDLYERLSEVIWKWSEPVLPEPAKRPDRAETLKDNDAGGLGEKLASLIIPQINFEGANIQDIVKYLRNESKKIDNEGVGVNIVLAEGLNVPPIDLILENIPMNEAIRYLCQKANLKYRINDQVLSIGNESIDFMDVRFIPVRSALIARIAPDVIADNSETEDLTGQDFSFDYEDNLDKEKQPGATQKVVTSASLTKYFKDRGVPFPPGATISYSRRSGKLTVKNTHENLRRLYTLLRNLDVEQPQVLIESKFVEINNTDLEEMGFEWWLNPIPRVGSTNPWVFQQNDTLVRPLGTNNDGVPSRVSTTSSKVVNDFVFPVFNDISSKIPKFELHMIMHAIDQSNNSEVLSAPKVIAKNGQDANIRMVREEYYPDTYSAPELVIVNGLFQYTPPIPEFSESTDVGINLTVTPNVSPDNRTISLHLNPQVIQLTGWSNYPISYIFGANSGTSPVNMAERSRRDIDVNVKTYDGDTLVIGGMLTEFATDNDDSFPGTDKIPLLGWLGRVQSSNSVKRNLMIFVTARIVNPDGLPVKPIRENGVFDYRR